jgi:hypothetical protein
LIGQPPLAEHKNYDMTTVIEEKKVEKKYLKKLNMVHHGIQATS